jgi:hypothetical protein
MQRQTAAALVIALAIAACTSASPPGEERVVAEEAAPTPDVDAVAPAQASPEPEAAPAPVEPTEPAEPAPPCAAAVADAPTPLFGDTVLIRPPVGVELVEMTPGFARSQAPTTSACDRVVKHMFVGVFENEPSSSLADMRDRTMAATDLLSDAITWTETHEQPNRLESAYATRATAEGATPVRGWFVITRMNDVVAWVLLESSAADFDALAPTFKASGERLLMLPRG